jgi:hypothetical protein
MNHLGKRLLPAFVLMEYDTLDGYCVMESERWAPLEAPLARLHNTSRRQWVWLLTEHECPESAFRIPRVILKPYHRVHSILFESNSRLTRIESSAFSFSSIESIVIPRNVQFIDGSAFCNVNLSSITTESGNNTIVVEKVLLIHIICHKLIRNFSRSSKVDIPNHIEILCSECFSYCQSLSFNFIW